VHWTQWSQGEKSIKYHQCAPLGFFPVFWISKFVKNKIYSKKEKEKEISPQFFWQKNNKIYQGKKRFYCIW
jgi:hypothetical protein